LVKLTVLINNQSCVAEAANDNHENKQEGSDVFEGFFDD
jgi:hypothetical protein